jgi:hypothetical protein
MDEFHRFAVFTAARDASFVALGATTLMIGFSFAPALALAIGANMALAFAIGLLLRVACLTDERIVLTEVWRALKPHERPVGKAGRRLARDDLQELLLRFAKAAAGVAIALYSSSMMLSLSKESRSLIAVVDQLPG